MYRQFGTSADPEKEFFEDAFGKEAKMDGIDRQDWLDYIGPAAPAYLAAYSRTEAFLKCVREELPYHPTTGFRYEVLTDDSNLRKQVDDMIFDFYGEENPRQLEEYQKTPKQGMTMGGIR